MALWHWIVAAAIYLLFKKQIDAKIKEIKVWLGKNKDIIEKWKKNSKVMAAYKELKAAIEEAQMDRKWSVPEILYIIGLAVILLKAIEEVEKEGGE